MVKMYLRNTFRFIVSLLVLVVAFWGFHINPAYAGPGSLGTCDRFEPIRTVYDVGNGNQIKVVGRNGDLIEFWSNGDCSWRDNIRDGNRLHEAYGVTFFSSGQGSSTAFAVRYGRKRDMLALYKAKGRDRPTICVDPIRDGADIGVSFLSSSTVDVLYGRKRDLVARYIFDLMKDDWRGVGGRGEPRCVNSIVGQDPDDSIVSQDTDC